MLVPVPAFPVTASNRRPPGVVYFRMNTVRRRSRLFAILVLLGAAPMGTPVGAQDARRDAADAERLVKALEAKAGSVVAEIGAGDGELTVALAKVVGPTGRIYSNELNTDSLATIRKRADEAGLQNVTTIEGKPDVANLPDGCCDGVFMRLVYHHFGDPPSMNASLLHALKPGGRLAIIDFTPPPPPLGGENPPGHRGEDNHHGITRATLETELKAAGFEMVSSSEAQREIFVVARRPINE